MMYVSFKGISTLGRLSIKLLGGLCLYMSFKLSVELCLTGDRVGKNIGDCG